MAKIVVECADPNDLQEIEKSVLDGVGRCVITYFKQHQVMIDAGKSKSERESARQIAEETGESPEAVRKKISRGKTQVGQPVPKRATTQNNSENLKSNAVSEKSKRGGKRVGAGRKTISTFNETNQNVEWARWTWNPVTGCNHGCEYCYARDIANRYFKEKFKPTFHPNRLAAPQNSKLNGSNSKFTKEGNKNVFVCSMADLFGEWVPDEWITTVFDTIWKAPQWNFILLTKNPKRYLTIDFPKNVWIGATADTQKRADVSLGVFAELTNTGNENIKFLSCEPLKEKVDFLHADIDWLIIGGQSKSSGGPAFQPQWKWVESLMLRCIEGEIPYYFKPNLTVRPRMYP